MAGIEEILAFSTILQINFSGIRNRLLACIEIHPPRVTVILLSVYTNTQQHMEINIWGKKENDDAIIIINHNIN